MGRIVGDGTKPARGKRKSLKVRATAASGLGGITKPAQETPFDEKSGTGPLDFVVSAAYPGRMVSFTP